ncbi:glycosyltransferase [Acidianus brierleyi]|uniref:Dolichyl-phosphate mannose synthase n=1 Tax=Acidianus brierleyi TaxID=41673 RepID=A0A2U9IDM7_9CREN|nr:glycosyltransferase [Acidianus brierleyi]AWR94086.1 glycosyltransferase [Acidianus brierleyi]
MLSIVIPAFNEEKRIERTLRALTSYFKNVDIVVVFDGNDKTPDIVKKFPVNLIVSKERLGKGGAIKKGIIESKGEFVLLLDADMPITVNELKKIVELGRDSDLLILNRKFVNSPKLRIILSKSFRIIVKLFFPSLIKIKDFQAGVKLLRRDKALKILDELIINDYLIDVNLIYSFVRNGFRIKEFFSSYLNDNKYSKISIKIFNIIILMFLSIIKLRVYYSPLRKILDTRFYLKVQNIILRLLR